jgi:hypothetical protein
MKARVRVTRSSSLQLIYTAGLTISFCHSLLAATIDDFSVGPIAVQRNGSLAATALQAGLDPIHVIGGAREVVVGEFGASIQTLTVDTDLRELQFSAPTGGGYFDLLYGSEAQPLNVDLTADGSDAFLVEFAMQGGFVTLNFLRVFTSSGEGALGGGNPGTIRTDLPDGKILMEYPFEAFSNSPDFTNVQRIELGFHRLSTVDGPVLLSFTTIPEPGAMALLGIASLPFIWRLRRRQSN